MPGAPLPNPPLLDQGRRCAPPRPALFAGLLPSARPSAPAARSTLCHEEFARQRSAGRDRRAAPSFAPPDTRVRLLLVGPAPSAATVPFGCPVSVAEAGRQGRSFSAALHLDAPPPPQGSAATKTTEGSGQGASCTVCAATRSMTVATPTTRRRSRISIRWPGPTPTHSSGWSGHTRTVASAPRSSQSLPSITIGAS
jgi:hypothetical protein